MSAYASLNVIEYDVPHMSLVIREVILEGYYSFFIY